MKILSYFYTQPAAAPQTDNADAVDSIIDEFVNLPKPSQPADDTNISIDPNHYRQVSGGKVPVLILPDLKIQDLKKSLYGLPGKTTIGGLHTRICMENRLNRGKYHLFVIDKQEKRLLNSSITLDELDVKREGYIQIHMGTI